MTQQELIELAKEHCWGRNQALSEYMFYEDGLRDFAAAIRAKALEAAALECEEFWSDDLNSAAQSIRALKEKQE